MSSYEFFGVFLTLYMAIGFLMVAKIATRFSLSAWLWRREMRRMRRPVAPTNRVFHVSWLRLFYWFFLLITVMRLHTVLLSYRTGTERAEDDEDKCRWSIFHRHFRLRQGGLWFGAYVHQGYPVFGPDLVLAIFYERMNNHQTRNLWSMRFLRWWGRLMDRFAWVPRSEVDDDGTFSAEAYRRARRRLVRGSVSLIAFGLGLSAGAVYAKSIPMYLVSTLFWGYGLLRTMAGYYAFRLLELTNGDGSRVYITLKMLPYLRVLYDIRLNQTPQQVARDLESWKTKPTTVLATANRDLKTGLISWAFFPMRHHDLMHQLYGVHPDTSTLKQGFVSSQGVFLDRTDAYRIALSADQIRIEGTTQDYLYTENLF